MPNSSTTDPIRVGFVMHKMQVAGAEVLVTQIIDRLRDEIDPTVLCLDDVGELGYRLRESGIPVISLERRPGRDWRVAKHLADEVKSRRIQVVHAHQYTPFFYTALARLRHGAKSKVLFTEHGRHYPDIVSWKRRWANRVVFKHFAETTTACCDFSTRALQTLDGFAEAFTLPNGVDIERLPPRGSEDEQIELRRNLGLDQDRRYAVCVARFHPVKDHATLIRGWARVHKQLPEARLLLVGDGEERENLVRQIVDLENADDGLSGLTASISFLGIRDDIDRILRACDVFTLTSVSEAASLTLLEAMASQCPSVVTQVGGNGEHLRQGVDGYLVPRGNDEALAEKLVQLLNDPSTSRRMGESARQQVRNKFHLGDAIERYLAHYRLLAGRQSVAAPSASSKAPTPQPVS